MINLIIFFLILIIIGFYLFKKKNNIEFFSDRLNIIQTWKTKEIPNKYKKYVDKVKKLNPDCNYIFFSDKDIDKFIKKKFPQYYNKFKSFKYTIQKIDFFRYLAVYYYGGVYLDLDMDMNKSFDNLDTSICTFPIEFEKSSDELLHKQNFYKLIGNYAFYAPKNDKFIKKIINNIMNNKIDVSNIKNHNKYIFYTTGPVMVTQSYIDYKNNINLIKPKIFKKASFGDYGKHVAVGTWK